MSEIQKQGIANSIISFAGVGLGYIYTGLLGPYILTPDQIGLTSTLMAVALITSHFARLGAPYIAIRFFPHYKETDNDKQGLLNFLILLTWAGFLLFLILYLLFQPWIVAAFKVNSALFADHNALVIPLVLLMSFFELFQAYSRAIFRSVLPTIMREVVWRLVVIAALLCYYEKLIDFETFVWFYAFAYAIPLLITIVYLAAIKELKLSNNFDLKGRRNELVRYGQFVFLSTVATVTINEIDKVMITSLSGLKNTGIYTVASFFSLVIQVPARSLMMIAAPLVAVFLANDELDKVERVYKKSSVNQLIAGLFIFAGIYINLDNIFHILPPVFAAGRYVVIFIALAKLFDLATGINGEIIINSKYYRYDLYFNLVLVIMIVGVDYFIIPRYGITGAAIGSAITIFIYNAVKSWFLWVVYRIQPFSIYTLIVTGIGILVIVIDRFVPVMHNVFADILLRSSIMTIIYGILIFASDASEDLNGLARKWMRLK